MVIGLASFSLAQTKAGQTSKPTHKMFFGTVNAVTLADANGTKSEITATDKTNTQEDLPGCCDGDYLQCGRTDDHFGQSAGRQ